MDNGIFETVDAIVVNVMETVETSGMNENEFLAMMGLLIKIYSVRNDADIADITSKLFLGIAQTEGALLREADD